MCALCYKLYVNSSDNSHIIEEIVPYLSDRLKDSDASVKMTAISTIYEISKIDQSLFVVTIPVLYQMLGEVSNNWVLIKIIKLLTEFCMVEPRLKLKLRPKFYDLLDSQKARSVQFEIIKSSLVLFRDIGDVLSDEIDVYNFALQKLSTDFVEQKDPNLRYLGLCTLETVLDEKTKQLFAPKLLLKF